jgi:hypothetical protein
VAGDTDDDPPTYSFYFKNNTSKYIRDFYLEDRNGNRYSKKNDGFANECNEGETLQINNLQRRDYRVFYEYTYDKKSGPYSQYTSSYFNLNSDKTYKVSSDEISIGILY